MAGRSTARHNFTNTKHEHGQFYGDYRGWLVGIYDGCETTLATAIDDNLDYFKERYSGHSLVEVKRMVKQAIDERMAA